MEFIKLPDLGEGVTEGELIRWLVNPGDVIQVDQPVAEFMTDKATVEIPSPIRGRINKLLAKPGDRITVGSAIAEIVTEPTTQEDLISRPQNVVGNGAKSESQHVTQNDRQSSGELTLALPDLGEGVTEGELVRWLVEEGQSIQVDQPIAEFMTDKATVEIPSPYSGILVKKIVQVGEKVAVKSPIAVIRSSETTGAVSQQLSTVQSSHAAPPREVSLSPANQGNIVDLPPADFKVLATPYTRRLARELGVDINQIKGTGLNGRVTRDDVLRAYEARRSQTVTVKEPSSMTDSSLGAASTSVVMGEPVESEPLIGLRRKIAENMKRSYSHLAHFTLVDEFNAQALYDLRLRLKPTAEKMGIKLTYLPFIIKAVVLALKKYPAFNATIDDEKNQILYKKFYHIGVAVDTGTGLVVPVVKHADQKSILEIGKEIQELAQLARDNKLKPEQLKGGTFTITNLGAIGGLMATPIINYPESAILGVYRMYDKPTLSEQGLWQNQKYMHLSITADHRLIDGALAARFLNEVMGYLSQPEQLWLHLR